MNKNEKKSADRVMARISQMSELAEEIAETILAELLESQQGEKQKTGTLLSDLIKMTQLLEKQYSLTKTLAKEQEAQSDLPQTQEAVIRKYLNERHQQQSRAEKALQKSKAKKHV